ncbi:MAG: hypothetical protein Ct9H300mP3_07700 [Gammaproteobacteria bacterium]|nr:MAG: hypothetical protein Ct9H300mP3_07700 [Gammaproteobacteria bacterium]
MELAHREGIQVRLYRSKRLEFDIDRDSDLTQLIEKSGYTKGVRLYKIYSIGRNKNFKSGDDGVIAYKSTNPFEFFHILNSKECEEQECLALFFSPEEKEKNTLWLFVCMEA